MYEGSAYNRKILLNSKPFKPKIVPCSPSKKTKLDSQSDSKVDDKQRDTAYLCKQRTLLTPV
jgi:hypothetical protein